jgi:hypothetical protein
MERETKKERQTFKSVHIYIYTYVYQEYYLETFNKIIFRSRFVCEHINIS